MAVTRRRSGPRAGGAQRAQSDAPAESAAQHTILGWIADGTLAIRVQLVSGKVLTGKQAMKVLLRWTGLHPAPNKLDWRNSRSISWFEPKGIVSIEVDGVALEHRLTASTAPQMRADAPAHTLPPGTQGNRALLAAKQVPARRASDDKIIKLIAEVYDFADRLQMKPPNVKEIAKAVGELLGQQGMATSQARITELAGASRFAQRRRPPGPRVYGTLLPFSLERWPKSGVEM